jgi:hypothetical protein
VKNIIAVDKDRTFVCKANAVDTFEQCAFTCPVIPQNGYTLIFLYIEADVFQYVS